MTGPLDETELRRRFEAEVAAAGLVLSERDRELLYAMWAAYLPDREALRAAQPAPDQGPWA